MKIRLTKHWNSVILYLSTSFQICINFFLLWNITIFWRTLVTKRFYLPLTSVKNVSKYLQRNWKTTQNHSKWFCQQSAIIYSPSLFICLFDFCTKIWNKTLFCIPQNNIRVSKQWHNLHFGMNYPFIIKMHSFKHHAAVHGAESSFLLKELSFIQTK